MPGKFEGEPDYLEYIWDNWVMEGDGESHYIDETDQEFIYFDVDAIDIDNMESAGIIDADNLEFEPNLVLWEDSQGFVNHRTFASRKEALDFIYE